ncbi:MAG: ABC transporter substrate-binding protein [Bosea sp.]|uniref:ABC transporter substrate-binding protein n=1 Tax=Bosea sp. (in: a-proteobacteria) TaxID=1871050 RepID=UPI00238E3151|nr:ABC transporter substrate-binding protein [Bosea sp. (in: a-proteobacteria)]MCP4737093.1 ABC transporter substrate-binding protein [Bosea sp. (in: a-proteobacteria)]
MKTTRFACAGLFALGLAAAAAPALARDLMVVGFGGGFQDNARKHLFQGYAAEKGVKVADDVYNGEMAKIYSMVKSNDVTYDVIMVEAPELARGCEDGVFEKLDWSVIDQKKFIPGGTTACGAGAVGWGVSLFYDQARNPTGPANYAELWDVQKFPGKRSLRSGAKMTLEIALLADGVPAADVYKVLATADGQKRAFAKLDQIKPHVVWWKSGTQPLQLVGSGEAAYAVGYVGRTIRANEGGAKYPVQWNTLLFSFDYWTVVRNSPNKAEGMKLISYMTDEKPLTNLAQDWAVSPANTAVANNPEVIKKNPGMVANHAKEGLFINTEFWVEHGEDLEARFNAWLAK